MMRIAPAANAIEIEIIGGEAFGNTPYPIVVASVPITTTTDHNTSIYFLLNPETFISLVEASSSGRLEMKISYQEGYIYCTSCGKCNSKRRIFSILSITEPMNNALPEAGLFAVAIFSPEAFTCLFSDLRRLDLLSKIRFAILYETPPKINPVAVADSV